MSLEEHEDTLTSHTGRSPSRLRAESPQVVVLPDDVTVRWQGQRYGFEVLVRATDPIPKSCAYHLFQVEILEGEDLRLGIAQFKTDDKSRSQRAFTYESKSGQCERTSVNGQSQIVHRCAAFKTGDVITCGVSFMDLAEESFVFFAKNGQMLEPYLPWNDEFAKGHVYPFCASENANQIIKFHVHGEVPDQSIWEAKLKGIHQERMDRRLGSVDWHKETQMCDGLVRDFLFHHGYMETLRLMDAEVDGKKQEDQVLEFARERRKVRRLVLDGQVAQALESINEKWPDIMETSLGLEMRVQGLVELISNSRYSEAVEHARNHLWPYLQRPEERDGENNSARCSSTDSSGSCSSSPPSQTLANEEKARIARSALGLLAIPQNYIRSPQAASTPHLQTKLDLFSADRRRDVADALNRALLFHPAPPRPSALESVLQQYISDVETIKEHNGGYGPVLRFNDL